MPKIKINKELCKGCGLCVNNCPKEVIIMSDTVNNMGLKTAKVKSMEKCTGCTFCAIVCPDCAIEVWK